MRVTRAVLPVMRKQKSGHIFNVASTAAYAPGPVIYHSSKFAVTGFSVALSFEVEPFGIKVTNVAPGMFRTDFYSKGKWGMEADYHIEDYDKTRWQPGFVAECQKNLQPGDPKKLAKVIIMASESKNPPLHLGIGEDAPAVMDSYCAKIKEDTDAWRDVASKTSFQGDDGLWVRPMNLFASLVDTKKYPEVRQKQRFELREIESVEGQK